MVRDYVELKVEKNNMVNPVDGMKLREIRPLRY